MATIRKNKAAGTREKIDLAVRITCAGRDALARTAMRDERILDLAQKNCVKETRHPFNCAGVVCALPLSIDFIVER
jgi:hypothetical protein